MVSQSRPGKLYKPGDLIGRRYKIDHQLGEGGFGVVYRAYHCETQQIVALKTIRDEFLPDVARRETFKKEALLWVNLEEHAFVLTALLAEEISGRLFVVTEYIAPDEKGRVTLQDYLDQAWGSLDAATILQWAIQFCHGMEHANAHGIHAHRDIKPGNILIRQDGMLKITDFGLAAAAEEVWKGGAFGVVRRREGRLWYTLLATEGRKICGTPGHIPPEVYEGKGADVQSDIYAFGIVLWQMVTGSPVSPFHAAEVDYGGDDEIFLREYQATVYEKQKTGNVPQVEGPLWHVIQQCLAFEPGMRYGDFHALRAALEGVYGNGVKVPSARERTAVFWNNKGTSLLTLGRHEEAIQCLDRALEIEPRYAPAWANKGGSLQTTGRHEEAVQCYDQALQIDPLDTVALTNKAACLKDLGRHDEAIYCDEQALKIDPRNAFAWTNKGACLQAIGRPEDAINCYDQALEIDPLHADAWADKGACLQAIGRPEDAINCYDQALEIDPRHADAWANKGVSLGVLGRNEETISCFDQALEIDPRDAHTWYNKAIIEEGMERQQDAARSYRKFLAVGTVQYPHLAEEAQQRLRALGGG